VRDPPDWSRHRHGHARSENLQDVAQSVTALSTEFIEKQALTNMYDLVGALPSVNSSVTYPARTRS
jgi:hypothetical protein